MNAWTKYPRTPHLPHSLGATSDDKRLKDESIFIGQRVVVSEKMDGENTTMYCDHIHARSIDSANHPSRNWVRAFHGTIQNDIPQGWRICVENMFAQHSIAYAALKSYAYGISIWDETNHCLPWALTLEWFEMLGIVPVSTFYVGVYDRDAITQAFAEYQRDRECEGYVVRTEGRFAYEKFSENVAKYVRANHVQTDTHWMHQEVVPNKLGER